jgi:hypothetical protein
MEQAKQAKAGNGASYGGELGELIAGMQRHIARGLSAHADDPSALSTLAALQRFIADWDRRNMEK